MSLAAALLIPPMIGGRAFPDRDLVLFATYSVIVVTLVGLGTALPAVVRGLGLGRDGTQEIERDRQAEQRVRLEAIDAVLAAIEAEDGTITRAEHVEALQRWHRDRREIFSGTTGESATLELRLLEVERTRLAGLPRQSPDGRGRRRIERELDLEDARLRHALVSLRRPAGRRRGRVKRVGGLPMGAVIGRCYPPRLAGPAALIQGPDMIRSVSASRLILAALAAFVVPRRARIGAVVRPR